MFSQLNFANKSDAVKFYKEYRCTPNKVFLVKNVLLMQTKGENLNRW